MPTPCLLLPGHDLAAIRQKKVTISESPNLILSYSLCSDVNNLFLAFLSHASFDFSSVAYMNVRERTKNS